MRQSPRRQPPAPLGSMRRPSRPLTIVSAADSAYFRCLLQLFKSLGRHVEPGQARLIAYDLGFRPGDRRGFSTTFPAVALRTFDFSLYPSFVTVRGRAVNSNAWKAQLIKAVAPG